MNTQQNIRGFTLIELLVVMAIVGLLASVVMVSFPTAQRSARDTERKSDLNVIRQALEQYWNLYEKYPPESQCTDSSVGCGGCGCTVYNYPNGTDWDANSDLQDLLPLKAFGKIPVDPINNSTYRYWYEPSGSGQSGCLVACCEWQLCAKLESTGANYCVYSARNSDTHPRGGW